MDLRNRREKLIYFASMIDGEGSIGMERLSPCKVTRKGKECWQRKKYYYSCRLCVVNTSEKLMNWMQSEFGGYIGTKKKQLNQKQCYRWQVLGINLEKLIIELIPFLFLKKAQALVLLEYRKTVGKTGWLLSDEILEIRRKLWLKCKELNKNGE